MEDLREATCACGCGQTFLTRSDTRIWLNSAHMGRVYVNQNKANVEAAKLAEPPPDRQAGYVASRPRNTWRDRP